MPTPEVVWRLRHLKVALVPVVALGLWLIATVIGAPLGIPTVAAGVVMWRDANALMRGAQGESRQLAVLCDGFGIVASAALGINVLYGFNDLWNGANLAALALAVAWIAVVFRAGVGAMGRTKRRP